MAAAKGWGEGQGGRVIFFGSFIKLSVKLFLIQLMRNNQQNRRAVWDGESRLALSKHSHSSSKALTAPRFQSSRAEGENCSRVEMSPLAAQQYDRNNIGGCLTEREQGCCEEVKPIRSILQKRKAAKLNQIRPADPSPPKRPQLALLTALCDTDRKMRDTNSTQCHSPRALSPVPPPRILQYRTIRLLGQGKFGEVFLAKHMATGFLGALKILRKSQVMSLGAEERDKIVGQVTQEIKIQWLLEHPNLIQLYDFFSDESNLYLFMELGSDGQLFELLEQRGSLSEETTSIVVREIARGIHYMHSQMVIHRDIKLENIVLTHGMAKICDFGWSVFEPREFRQTICGTPLYLSPEVLQGRRYNDKIDIWALGTLAHELYTRETPFQINRHQDLEKIVTADFQMREGSPELRSFVNFILRKNPSKRPDADILLSHPFISKYKELQTSDELHGVANSY